MKQLIKQTTESLNAQKVLIEELINKVSIEFTKKTNELNDLTCRYDSKKQETYKLEVEDRKFRLMIPKHKAQIDNLEKQIISKNSELTELKTLTFEIEEIRKSKKNLDKELIVMNELKNISKEESIELNENINKLKSETDRLNEQNNNLKTKTSSLRTEHSTHQSKVKYINSEKIALQIEFDKLKDKFKLKNNELTKIDNQKKSTLDSIEGLKDSRKKLDLEINTLSQTIQDKEFELTGVDNKFDIERAKLKSEQSKIIALKKQVLNLIINNKVGSESKRVTNFMREYEND